EENIGLKKNFEVDNNKLLINFYPHTGNVGFSAVYNNLLAANNSFFSNKIEKYPLIEKKNNYNSSYFFLYVDGKCYKLKRSSDVACWVVKSEQGVKVSYKVRDFAQVDINYVLVHDKACAQISAVISNISNEEHEYGLCSVYDTFLGETSGLHFSTKNINSISNKVIFDNFENESYLRSSDGYSSIQFTASMNDTDAFEKVILASESDFSFNSWFPSVAIGKPFTTVESYGDSVAAFYWKRSLLATGQNRIITFYVSAACNGNVPEYIREASEAKVIKVENAKSNVIKETSLNANNAKINEEKIDSEYIQSLLDRIEMLKAGDENGASEEEIKKLNAEIDVILQMMRQK
nr:hypothetical protein [Treponema sp.]